MLPFWIINKNRFMYLVMALNKEAATEKFNEKNQVRADYTFPAEPAPGSQGMYLLPNVPAWMIYTLASDVRLVSNTKLKYHEDQHGKNHPISVNIAHPIDKTFFYRPEYK